MNDPDSSQTQQPKPSRFAQWYASLRQGLKGDKETYVHAAKTTPRQPCFRSSLLWGIGLGCLIGLHRWKETGRAMTVLDWGFGGWFVISCATWVLCRKQQTDSQKQTMRLYKQGMGGQAPGTGGKVQTAEQFKKTETLEGLFEKQKRQFLEKHGFEKSEHDKDISNSTQNSEKER